jgi:hypothetical protein
MDIRQDSHGVSDYGWFLARFGFDLKQAMQ